MKENNYLMKLCTLTVADHFNISSDLFEKKGIFNPTLKQDAPLFIDPCLLKSSKYEEFKNEAKEQYHDFFNQVILDTQFAQTLNQTDKSKAYENIIKRFRCKEQKGLCLGYAQNNNKGRGIGQSKATQIFYAAEHLIIQGLSNKNIFSLLCVLEDNIGADLISDMTAHIIRHSLYKFTQRMSKELNIPVSAIRIDGQIYFLPKHPIENTPLLLLPYDILSTLPEISKTETFFKNFCSLDHSNDVVKMRVNKYISEIFQNARDNKVALSKVKEELRDYIYDDSEVARILAEHISTISGNSYNVKKDEFGLLNPIKVQKYVKKEDMLTSETNSEKVIDLLVNFFSKKVSSDTELKRNLLYDNGKPKTEKAWQSAFNLFAYMFLEFNNLDISAEAPTGRGPVDFKISRGSQERYLIEIKLSTNSQYKKGLTKQLEAYKKATNNVKKAYYIYIDFEDNDTKRNELLAIKNELQINSEIVFVDGRILPSASNL